MPRQIAFWITFFVFVIWAIYNISTTPKENWLKSVLGLVLIGVMLGLVGWQVFGEAVK